MIILIFRELQVFSQLQRVFDFMNIEHILHRLVSVTCKYEAHLPISVQSIIIKICKFPVFMTFIKLVADQPLS